MTWSANFICTLAVVGHMAHYNGKLCLQYLLKYSFYWSIEIQKFHNMLRVCILYFFLQIFAFGIYFKSSSFVMNYSISILLKKRKNTEIIKLKVTYSQHSIKILCTWTQCRVICKCNGPKQFKWRIYCFAKLKWITMVNLMYEIFRNFSTFFSPSCFDDWIIFPCLNSDATAHPVCSQVIFYHAIGKRSILNI